MNFLRVPLTFSFYIARFFLLNVGMVFLALSVLILLVDAVEILRQASHKNIDFHVLLRMVLLKYPMLAQKVLPFGVLFGTVLTYARLSRTQELSVSRSAGISVWQFMLPSLASAFLLGLFMITVFNPIAGVSLQQYEKLERKHFLGRTSLLSFSSSGFWLRQKSNGLDSSPDGEMIIHALRVSNDEVELYDVILFAFTKADRFIKRVDAKKAILHDGYWTLENAIVTSADRPAEKHARYILKTGMTLGQIQDSFAIPETISFWSLPGFITMLKEAGFSALRHRMHWHRTLALPFMLVAMVLIAAVFSLHTPKQIKANHLMVASIIVGFLIYFSSDVIGALGLSGNIPVILAAWAPASICILIGAATLLHLEDG